MKEYFLLLAFIFGVCAASGKPGSCPVVTSASDDVISAPSQCTIDINCPGSEKCCDGMCLMPVCEGGEVAQQCDEDPCEETSCMAHRRAKCFPDACNSCTALWLSRLSIDVTSTCDDPAKISKFAKKKTKWIKKKCAKLIKRGGGRLPKMCQAKTEADSADDFEAAQTQDWDAKREKWQKKFMKAKGKKKSMKQKMKASKKAQRQKKRERKQAHLASMTEEEKEEFWAAKRQAMIARLEKKIAEKKGSKKTARWEKKLAKLEAKQVAKQTPTETVTEE